MGPCLSGTRRLFAPGSLQASGRSGTRAHHIAVHTDNQQVVDGWEAGQAWLCASHLDVADLWRAFWTRVQDIGLGIQVVEAKAHVPFS